MSEAGSAFFATPVNIQSFTTDFTFQLSNPSADGITFTIQNDRRPRRSAPTAVRWDTGASARAWPSSSICTATQGEGETPPACTPMAPSNPARHQSYQHGIDLHSGDYFDAHLTYDGTNLNLTLTDEITLAT